MADKCNICGYEKFEKIADKLRDSDKHGVYRCMQCGHAMLLPLPALDEEKEFYNKDSQEKSVRKTIDLDNLERSFRPDIMRRADFISSMFPKSASMIDIGCGYGFFPEEMKQRGYGIRGIEVSKERRELAKKITNVQIDSTNIADPKARIELEPADVVTLFHVLEHMIDPISFCRRIKGLVRNCFIVEVPNVDELLIRECASYKAFYWNRAHLNYFSAKTLMMVLRGAGFKKVEMHYVQRYGVENLCNWLSTGKPQLEKPVMQMKNGYEWLETHYRQKLAVMGKTDSLFALAYI